MELTVQRRPAANGATLGDLSIDGVWECFTLERAPGEGKGPIPAGTYKVIIDFSNRFQRDMPHILDVPGFDGIRIHSGNTDKDTEGCLLLGRKIVGPDFIGESHLAFDAFFPKLKSALDGGQDVSIAIQ
jgi:hypothetical protein